MFGLVCVLAIVCLVTARPTEPLGEFENESCMNKVETCSSKLGQPTYKRAEDCSAIGAFIDCVMGFTPECPSTVDRMGRFFTRLQRGCPRGEAQ